MNNTISESSYTNRASSGLGSVELTKHVLNLKQCIICQKNYKKSRVTSKPNGREKLKHAGTIRQYCVLKLLRSIGVESYGYHVDTCCKKYTLKKTLMPLP